MDDRRDDWAHGVDENLASLNAGQRIWERELLTVRQTLAEIDKLLRGNPEQETDGAMARLHQQENEINLLKAVVLKDKLGNNGLVARVESLETQERTSESRWKFATAVTVAIISLVGLIVTNWPHISQFLEGRPGKLDQIIENGKHPKNRYHHYRIVQPEQDDNQ